MLGGVAEPCFSAGKGAFGMSQGTAPEEMNVYQNAEARFEEAAKKLGLEQGI